MNDFIISKKSIENYKVAYINMSTHTQSLQKVQIAKLSIIKVGFRMI